MTIISWCIANLVKCIQTARSSETSSDVLSIWQYIQSILDMPILAELLIIPSVTNAG